MLSTCLGHRPIGSKINAKSIKRIKRKDIMNNRILYVQMPRTTTDHSFCNSNEWVDTAIKFAGSKHSSMFESAYGISNHIIRFYCDSFIPTACENQNVPICKETSSTQFQAILHVPQRLVAQEKKISKNM
jgi:hypothetical protein